MNDQKDKKMIVSFTDKESITLGIKAEELNISKAEFVYKATKHALRKRKFSASWRTKLPEGQKQLANHEEH